MSGHGETRYDESRTPLLTVNDVASLLAVSRDSVYRLVRCRELVPYRVGERLRFAAADVDAYLERRRERAPGS